MMSQDPLMVRVTRRFRASPERVFDAWLDPVRARKFLFATETGEITRVEIDARVGGGFTIVDRRDGEDVGHYGKYLEIDRPRRLVFDFSVDKFETAADRITIEIVPVEGGCELTLTHEMKPEFSEYKERTEKGWSTILEGLGKAL